MTHHSGFGICLLSDPGIEHKNWPWLHQAQQTNSLRVHLCWDTLHTPTGICYRMGPSGPWEAVKKCWWSRTEAGTFHIQGLCGILRVTLPPQLWARKLPRGSIKALSDFQVLKSHEVQTIIDIQGSWDTALALVQTCIQTILNNQHLLAKLEMICRSQPRWPEGIFNP